MQNTGQDMWIGWMTHQLLKSTFHWWFHLAEDENRTPCHRPRLCVLHCCHPKMKWNKNITLAMNWAPTRKTKVNFICFGWEPKNYFLASRFLNWYLWKASGVWCQCIIVGGMLQKSGFLSFVYFKHELGLSCNAMIWVTTGPKDD